MAMKAAMTGLAAAFLLGGALAGHWAFGNGGPFVVKYPSGDPAAKGVLARLDPSLKPGKETRLRVVKEELGVTFGSRAFSGMSDAPLAEVSAVYTIENPTGEEIKADFGFPILRGIYLIGGMTNTVKVEITADKEKVKPILISNSVLFRHDSACRPRRNRERHSARPRAFRGGSPGSRGVGRDANGPAGTGVPIRARSR